MIEVDLHRYCCKRHTLGLKHHHGVIVAVVQHTELVLAAHRGHHHKGAVPIKACARGWVRSFVRACVRACVREGDVVCVRVS